MNRELATPQDVFAWAESFTNLEKGTLPFDKRNYRLDRMRRLLGLFDDPDSGLRIIHVAGTKGKGSTSALLASILDAAGHRTGLYTSPHVSSPFERIAIAGEPSRPELLVRIGGEVKGVIDSLPRDGMPGHFAPTTFELYTLLAFLYFREAGCEEAVIEVGIGGRLDATNIVMSESAVITPLDLEHMEVLGDTIEQIAFEKAGIIKPGMPAFAGFQPPAAKQVLRDTALARGSSITFLDEQLESLGTTLDARGTTFRLHLSGDIPVEFRLSLLGEFQAENAALACLTLRRTRPEIPLDCYRDGLLAASLPGRMEVVGTNPPVVLDGAHTPLAVSRLVDSFDKIFPGEAVLVFGSVAGKRPREMASILARRFPRIVISTPGTFKESNPEQVFEIFRSLNPDTVLEKMPEAALRRARQESGGTRPILVTGSFYMVAEIRRLLA
ncbi:MAG: folylpolyglutamate synthase/dihydrofolate synthase family protein [Spirochaetia bacterium]|jgi:dihydrofolate synthase/folylpolyglutamate synthase